MTVDPTKIAYSSSWDIDQLLASTTVPVSSGTTSIYTITGTVLLPDFKVQFQPTGSTFWYEAGTSSTNGTVAGQFTFSSFINGSAIFIKTTTGGTARYFVWADKFDY